MTRDPRYKNAKHLIETGSIQTIREIFDNKVLPKYVVLTDLGLNPSRFNKLLAHVEEFVVEDLFRFAQLLEIDEATMLKLMLTQYQQSKKTKKKK